MKPVNAAAAQLPAVRSETFGLSVGRELVAAALLYPLAPERPGEHLVELAFVCRPILSRHMLSLIRHAHLTRVRLVQSGPVRVRAHVHSGQLPGKRLALLCGMKLVGRFGAFGRYEFESQLHERLCQESAANVPG
jgi:hypothetical protein